MLNRTSAPGIADSSSTGLTLLLPGFLLAILTLLGCSSPQAATSHAGGDVHVVVSQAARYYDQVADAIADHVKGKYPDKTVRVHSTDNLGSLQPAGDSLLICIGTPASRRALELFPRQPQLNLFITRQVWDNLAGRHPEGPKAVLLVDQPIARQFALARVLAPDAEVFATVIGPASADKQPSVATAAKEAGITLRSATLAADSNPLAVLTPLLAGADVFVPIPDTTLVNRSLAKWALYLAFQYRIPVIGFSQAYTEAGAAASIFTSTDDISRQAVGWLDGYFSNSEFDGWRTYEPAYFTVSVNASVVRTLGLSTPGHLHQQVLRQLGDTFQ